ncbi:MAG TPA: hypothetical protein VGB00_16510 [Pyrinomonadaceae bacterium]|jgi:hypothetical protein
MKTRPIHENLDTSFVNLSALLRYLQRRQFAGRVRVELSGYEADIILLEGNKIRVREHDRIAGRTGEGEEALQRLLIRAREPGGTINVYQTIVETAKNPSPADQPKPVAAEAKQISESLPKDLSNGNANSHKTPKPVIAEEIPPPKSAPRLPDFPFDLTNEVEARARRAQQLSPPDWQTLLQLIGELLGTIDKDLAVARLNFSAAFAKVRAEIAVDYPFLNPANDVFEYADGKVSMRERASAGLLVAGINEALRRILGKLGASPKFSQIYRALVQKILDLIRQRKPLYEKFFITPQLERFLIV